MESILSAPAYGVNPKVNFHEWQLTIPGIEIEDDACEICNGAGELGGYYATWGDIEDDITECFMCFGSGYGLGVLIRHGYIEAPPIEWSPEEEAVEIRRAA